MTGIYVIKIGDAAAKQWVQFSYEKTLNGMSASQIALDGISSVYAAEFEVDNEMFIYKTGTLKFRGIIVSQDSLTAGGIVLSAKGIEIELEDKKSPMVGGLLTRAWTATSDNTILSTLVTSVFGWTVNVGSSSSQNVDFRTSATESVWNAVIRLISQTGKDIDIDQANKVVFMYDELTRSDKFSFIEGKNAFGISRKKSRSLAGKVIVYGKGDGESQIVGSNGSGTPVFSIIDRNIITTDEADARALVEYNKLNPETKSYTLTPTSNVDNINIGDDGIIANNSAGINEAVDVVRLKILVDGNGTEKISMEVTNPAFRLASKNSAEEIARQNAAYNQSQSSMQGSGNQNLFGSGINAKTNQSLKIPFYISPSMVNEAGNINISAINVSYDIDPYNRQFGTGSFDGSDPQVQNNSQDNDEYFIIDEEEDDIVTGALANVWTTIIEWTNLPFNGQMITFYLGLYVVDHSDSSLFSIHARIYNPDTGEYFPNTTGIRLIRGEFPFFTSFNSGHEHTVNVTFASSGTIVCPINPLGLDFEVQLIQDIPGETAIVGTQIIYDVESRHKHDAGAYDINAADLDHISIGDGIDEGSLNSSSVNLYLDFWNEGTSQWDNKVTISNTGETLEIGVDISDGGNYPDVIGWWRVRVEPITANADFAQGTVELINFMDN